MPATNPIDYASLNTPFIDPSSYSSSQFLQNYPGSSAFVPTTGGQPRSNNNKGPLGGMSGLIPGVPGGLINDISTGHFNAMDLIDPSGLFGSLFGGDSKPSWQPYQQNGQYYWADPSQVNPVPLSNIPGINLSPTDTYRDLANNVRAISDIAPYLTNATNLSSLQSALGQLGIAQTTSPAYANLMTQLYNTYGPGLNAIGNQIAQRNAMAQAQTEAKVMQGPGTDLVKGAYDLSQIFDKPYYDTRSTTANRLTDLLNSIDLSGGLSSTERDEITKGLSRQNQQAGTEFTPSQTNVVSNAMQYGQAGYQRKLQQQGALSSAISSASAFLPTSKSGVDVFQVATGRPSMPNTGNSLFPGVQTTGSDAGANLGNQLLGGTTALSGQNAQILMNQANINANKKDWLDMLSQFTGSIGNLGGMAGGLLCWVAREVYGADNPKWLLFREWLTTKAPKWLLYLYAKYGERFAKFISNKPKIKYIIRMGMNYVISTNYQSC